MPGVFVCVCVCLFTYPYVLSAELSRIATVDNSFKHSSILSTL